MAAKRQPQASLANKPSLPLQQASATISVQLQLWHPDAGIVFGSAATVTAAPEPTGETEARALGRKAGPPFAQRLRPTLYEYTSVHSGRAAERSIHSDATTHVCLEDSVETTPKTTANRDFGDALKEAQDILRELIRKAEAQQAEEEEGAEEEAEEDSKGKEEVEESEGGIDDDAVRPPDTTLAYKMSPEQFQAAREAKPDSAESFWTYAMYRHVEDGSPVKVHYSKSLHTTERICRQYFADEPVLGFDLEWMASAMRWQGPRRNVCLVQLASPSRVGLFHLSLYPARERGGVFLDDDADSLVAPTLRRILEDVDTIKTGVFIQGDATRLRNNLGIGMRGTVELSHLHKLVQYSRTGEVQLINRKLVSLSVQVEEHLRLPLFKGADVRSSDWCKPLSMEQILCG